MFISRREGVSPTIKQRLERLELDQINGSACRKALPHSKRAESLYIGYGLQPACNRLPTNLDTAFQIGDDRSGFNELQRIGPLPPFHRNHQRRGAGIRLVRIEFVAQQ